MIDPSRRVWELYVEDGARSMQFSEARYDHRQMPFVQETVQFIVDALNAAERRESLAEQAGRFMGAAYERQVDGAWERFGASFREPR